MNVSVTESFQKKAHKLCKTDPQLRKALAEQFSLFLEDHRHPSLRLHKLQGQRSEQYATWILEDLRALGVKGENEYIFFDIVRHDEY